MPQDKKRVLMFCPKFFGYENKVAEAIRQEGFEVDLYDERPNNGAFCKTMLRYNIALYRPVTRRYYNAVIEENRQRDYEYIFVVKSEAIDKDIFGDLKAAFPKAKFVLYLWDGLDNVPNGKEKIKLYDRVLTFDPVDAREYSLLHRPLFYCNDYAVKYTQKDSYEYEVAFIGTAHSIRPRIVASLEEQCRARNKKCYSYLFLPNPIVYLYNKLLNRSYKGVKKSDIHFESISPAQINSIYENSCCILDVEHAAQRGLTMRTIEMIGVGRKLITTNKSIKEYDFYNENNICVIDRDNPKVSDAFWTSSYEDVPGEIIGRYSLSSFVKDIFDIRG